MPGTHPGVEPATLGRDLLSAFILLLAEHPSHGWDVAVALRDDQLATASMSWIYRAMRRMEPGGLVASECEPADTPAAARRRCRLTTVGEATLDDLAVTPGRLHLDDFGGRHQAVFAARRRSLATPPAAKPPAATPPGTAPAAAVTCSRP